jgi:hypothetical protein
VLKVNLIPLKTLSITKVFCWNNLYNYNLTRLLSQFIFFPVLFQTYSILNKGVRNQLSDLIRDFSAVDNEKSGELRYGDLNQSLQLDTLNKLLPSHLKPLPNALSMRLFMLYLSLLGSAGDPDLQVNPQFKVFFIWDKQDFPCFNAIKLHQRWVHSYTLIYNLFYNQTAFLIFSHKILQKEAYSVSWAPSSQTYSLFKYSLPYFSVEGHPSGAWTETGFAKLIDGGLELAFVSDLRYHYRTAMFLKKQSVYTIGLAPYNLDPWALRYPIIVGADTLITQYFFIKLLFFVRQEAGLSYFHRLSIYQS